MSLDCCVGPLDDAIAKGKGALEKALGIGIAGYLDTGYTWSTSHPGSPANISGRYFDKDYNKIEFNDFHIALDLPEKRFGVGYHVSGDFGRTGFAKRRQCLEHDCRKAAKRCAECLNVATLSWLHHFSCPQNQAAWLPRKSIIALSEASG